MGKHELVNFLIQAYRASIRRATAVLQLRRATYFSVPSPRDDRAERRRIREIVETRVRYGVERIHVLLRREGWLINHKKTYRIDCEEGLNLRRKRPRRRVAAALRMERPEVSTVNACWGMDFVADQLFNGQKIRALTVVDGFSRESLAFTVDYALKAGDECLNAHWFLSLSDARDKIQIRE
ncbi:transposase [Pandoraea horticolens]|uniref:Transposase n=1 Tax=Pandoraea horticolens TaxID=2508298 RepID=A0A5E4Z1G8_9BURK|nr:IS3 family transposase [Pandoraea horticolens]VVE54527.1 transposase [Pandoraea horticolens]